MEGHTALEVCSTHKEYGGGMSPDNISVSSAAQIANFRACLCFSSKLCFFISWVKDIGILNNVLPLFLTTWLASFIAHQLLMDIFCFIRALLCWLLSVYYQLPFFYN
jgi:hypothetical protein